MFCICFVRFVLRGWPVPAKATRAKSHGGAHEAEAERQTAASEVIQVNGSRHRSAVDFRAEWQSEEWIEWIGSDPIQCMGGRSANCGLQRAKEQRVDLEAKLSRGVLNCLAF